MVLGIVELYCGKSGKKGFYNSQEIGIARAFKAKGHDCIIFYPQLEVVDVVEEKIEDGIRIVYCPAKALGVHSKYDWNILLRYSIEAVQIGSDNQLFLPSLVSFCNKQHIRFYNYIGTIQSDSPNKIKKFFLNFLFTRNLKIYKYSKCFAKTKNVYNELKKLGVTNVDLMPVGLDLSIIPLIEMSKAELRFKLRLPEDKKLVLFVGRIDIYKQPFKVIELMKKLPEQYYFLIIGTGKLDEQLQNQLETYKFQERCCWIKRIANERIHEYYACSDYFVNFNDKEIFGMSILEAMYQGCTVIANHAPGPDSIIEHGKSGYLVSDVNEMILYIQEEKQLDNYDISSRISEHFTWARSVEKVSNWLENEN